MQRRTSTQVTAGGVKIGGGAPIPVQSMLSAPSANVPASVRQAKALEQAGCQILRMAIPDMAAVHNLIPAVKKAVSIPLVADIHFDYKLALESAAAGIDKIRINPGNIGGDSRALAWRTLPGISVEAVLSMDWTVMGAPPPIFTPPAHTCFDILMGEPTFQVNMEGKWGRGKKRAQAAPPHPAARRNPLRRFRGSIL